jgi:glucokinase
MNKNILGIEIGGTKLQLGVGNALSDSLDLDLERRDIVADRGASGILEQIESCGRALLQRNDVSRIGVGFGGPVTPETGCTVTSHQIEGWDDFPLAEWLRKTFDKPVVLGNDCDCAALAEARFGAGQGCDRVFFLTVGTGVGGGFVVDGQLQGKGRPAIAEIGHLRPGLHAADSEMTVESLASGWGISAEVQQRFSGSVTRSLESARRSKEDDQIAADADEEFLSDLLQRCDAAPENLTTKMIAQSAAEGNQVAIKAIDHACRALGWAIGQAITLQAPDVVVIGGGVSLMGEQLFFEPVRKYTDQYVFPPLRDSYKISPVACGETVVVRGAIALGSDS